MRGVKVLHYVREKSSTLRPPAQSVVFIHFISFFCIVTLTGHSEPLWGSLVNDEEKQKLNLHSNSNRTVSKTTDMTGNENRK